MNYNELINYIILNNGFEKQVLKTVEELGELSHELLKNINDKKENINDIISEIADVEIMIHQIKILYNLDENKIDKIKEYKLLRQKVRIAEK